jgi:integrase
MPHDRHASRRIVVSRPARRSGKTWSLPREPGHPEFEAAYLAAVTGQPRPEIRRLPGAAHPRSLRAAWRIAMQTIEWKKLRPETQANQIARAERFFTKQVEEGLPLRFGDMPIDSLERRHVKAILARFANTPHAAAHILCLLRRLTGVALDEEWITVDPTYRIKFRPPYKGWKAWPAEVRAAFETRWPFGSVPRTVYSLCLYQGHRRSDVSSIKWADLEADQATKITQRKGGKSLWLPMHPELLKALEAAERKCETIVATQYGRPFSRKALGMRMQDWTRAAGIPPGYTLHGLRKTLGKLLAESGATTKQIMSILGHTDIAHAELYTKEAEQKKLARDGINAGGRHALSYLPYDVFDADIGERRSNGRPSSVRPGVLCESQCRLLSVYG